MSSEVDVVLADLAVAAAALPQAYAQLSEVLQDAKDDHVLETDTVAGADDPTLVVDTASPSDRRKSPLSRFTS